MQEMIKKVEEAALQEIQKNGFPRMEHFQVANEQGQRLAKLLKEDKDIVLLGTILMDVKLGECMKEGKLAEHIERGSTFSKELLQHLEIDQAIIDKVIEGHHKTSPWKCKEAEIVANADCYRFLHPRGIFAYLKSLDKRCNSTLQALKQLEKKMDEKWDILTLDICKQELSEYYHTFKKLMEKAREKT